MLASTQETNFQEEENEDNLANEEDVSKAKGHPENIKVSPTEWHQPVVGSGDVQSCQTVDEGRLEVDMVHDVPVKRISQCCKTMSSAKTKLKYIDVTSK